MVALKVNLFKFIDIFSFSTSLIPNRYDNMRFPLIYSCLMAHLGKLGRSVEMN